MTKIMLQQAGFGQRHQHDSQRQVGDDQHDIGKAHEQVFYPPAVETGHNADAAPDENRNKGSKEAHDQRDARPVNEIRQNVPAGIVGAKGVRQAGSGINVVDADLEAGLGVVRGDPGGKNGGKDSDDQQYGACQGHPVVHQVLD